MTDKELLALVTRYTEACDDLGCDLFAQGAEKHKELHDKATALWREIESEVGRLHAEAAKSERRAIAFGDCVQTMTLAMRAAVVDARLQNSDAGIRWIENTLLGPGHFPDVDAAGLLGGAQALFDKEMAEHEAFRAAHPGLAAPRVGAA